MEPRRVCDKCHKALRKEIPPEVPVPMIWILGGPGCGKGTQCDKIVNKFGFMHISSGDLLRRDVRRSRSQMSRTIINIMATGKLASTEKVLQLIKAEIYENISTAKGFLIDGFPRTKEQGIIFEEVIGVPQLMLLFDVSRDVMIERVLQRGKSSGRVDDNEETIVTRLETYTAFKAELLTYYQDKIKIIDGSRGVDDVFADVVPLIKSIID